MRRSFRWRSMAFGAAFSVTKKDVSCGNGRIVSPIRSRSVTGRRCRRARRPSTCAGPCRNSKAVRGRCDASGCVLCIDCSSATRGGTRSSWQWLTVARLECDSERPLCERSSSLAGCASHGAIRRWSAFCCRRRFRGRWSIGPRFSWAKCRSISTTPSPTKPSPPARNSAG